MKVTIELDDEVSMRLEQMTRIVAFGEPVEGRPNTQESLLLDAVLTYVHAFFQGLDELPAEKRAAIMFVGNGE